jgi:hypothetical protein
MLAQMGDGSSNYSVRYSHVLIVVYVLVPTEPPGSISIL